MPFEPVAQLHRPAAGYSSPWLSHYCPECFHLLEAIELVLINIRVCVHIHTMHNRNTQTIHDKFSDRNINPNTRRVEAFFTLPLFIPTSESLILTPFPSTSSPPLSSSPPSTSSPLSSTFPSPFTTPPPLSPTSSSSLSPSPSFSLDHFLRRLNQRERLVSRACIEGWSRERGSCLEPALRAGAEREAHA